MSELRLRCYVCGKKIDGSDFALVSMSKVEVDRTFALHVGDCLADVGDDAAVMVVAKIRTTKEE